MNENDKTNETSGYTAADALIDALQESGVSYLFSNLGSDHAGIIESLAKARQQNRDVPEVIICPHETVAMSAAHGYAQATGQAQAVLVHIDVGTQNLGGALHNAYRGRVPVFVFAGATPYTMFGELPGGRNRAVNFLQDVYDQRGIVREYVKWDYEVHTGKNVKQLVYRGIQLAMSEPRGPVYLTAAREVLEEAAESHSRDAARGWVPLSAGVLPEDSINTLVAALLHAQKPLIVTSYVGRNHDSVAELVRFCQALAVPVVEQRPSYLNFPANHPLHLGYEAGELAGQADVILVLDCDVPWIPSLHQISDDCRLFYLDIDPLKERIPLWNFPAQQFFKADSVLVLRQLNAYLQGLRLSDKELSLRDERWARFTRLHEEMRQKWRDSERLKEGGEITPQWLTACLREYVDEHAIVVNETTTNARFVMQHLPRVQPGTFMESGGSALGWNGGAALGAKLAHPDQTVVNLVGDGSYFFSVPASVHWVSRRYGLPFLTVIYNNQGWNATKENVLRLHPHGHAKRQGRYWVDFDPPADLARVAEAAGGAYARTVASAEQLRGALQDGFTAVREGRSAVIDVRLSPI